LPPFVGFALVTHNQPQQTAYLCHKLSRLFDHPPIAIHHDYSKCVLDPATLPAQTRIVKDWVTTGWGKATVIDAYLAALRLLHAHNSPEWTISLSAADYPIKSADRILNDLRNVSADGFIDFRQVSKGCVQPPDARSIASAFQRPGYMALAYERYLSFSVIPRVLLRHIGNRTVYLSGELLTRFFTPFSTNFRPFAGDWWHTINRRAAAVLMEDTAASRRLRRFLNHRPLAEESYHHTLLLNQPELHIENDSHRFCVWNGGKPHPELLGYDDIATMVNSPAHFARKFPFDLALYSAVDAAVHNTSSVRSCVF
jgi:hypothetical protein